MKLNFICLSICLLFSFCCKKEQINKPSTTENLKLLWKTYRGDNRISGCTTPILTNNGIIYSQDFYLGEDKSRFFMFDKNTGEIQWEWSDYFNEKEVPLYILDYYSNESAFTFSVRGNGYGIAPKTGETLWKGEFGSSGAGQLKGIGSKIFGIFGRPNKTEILKIGNIESGYYDDIFSIDSLPPNTRHIIREPAVHVNTVGDTLLYFESSIYPLDPTDPGYPKSLVAYNITKSKIEYQKPLKIGHATRAGVIFNNHIYFNEFHSITCYSLDDLKLKWEKNVGSIASVTDFLIEDGKLYLNSEEPYLYCLDPETGVEIWKTRSPGTSSHIGAYKGKLYMVGGGSGNLHCYDAGTGEELYEMESPDYAENSQAFFNSVLTLDKESGRLYLASFQSAMCYEILD